VTARTRAEAVLVLTTMIWGSTFAAMKLGLQEMSPLALTATRFLLAAIFYLVFFRRKLFPISAPSVFRGSILGLFLFLGFVAQNVGLQYTTASKSAFITSLTVVFVPLLQVIIERRSPKLGNIIGVCIVSTGLWFLTSPTGSSFNEGDALTLLCAVFFAVYIVYLDVVSKEMTTLRLTFLQLASTSIYALIAVVAFEHVVVSSSAGLLSILLYLTLFATVLTTFIQTRFQKDTTPTRAGIIFTVEPVFACIIAYALLNEQIGPSGMLGGALIIVGVITSELSDAIPFLNTSFDSTEDAPSDRS